TRWQRLSLGDGNRVHTRRATLRDGVSRQFDSPLECRRDIGSKLGGDAPIKETWSHDFWSGAISPDGRQIAAGHRHNRVFRWNLQTGKELAPLVHHSGQPVLAIKFSPDGPQLASACGATIQFWDAQDGRPIREICASLGTSRVTSLAFNHDGTRLASGGG